MTAKRNLVANYLGSIWVALMGFVFVPVYLKFVGAAGYGLVGFFITLSAILAYLDSGLGAAAMRESARFEAADEAEQKKIHTLLHAMEAAFWGISALCGVVIALGATFLVDYWLNIPQGLRDETIIAIRWMALAISVQLPLAFYTGCLNGFQKQVTLNIIGAIGATARYGGAALVLWLIEPTMTIFFAWHATITTFWVIAQRQVIANKLKKSPKEKGISLGSLKTIKSFLGGVGAINVLSLLLTQTDKVILSKVLSLSDFGYYTLAWMLGTAIYKISGPLFNVYYPRLIQLVQRNEQENLLKTYRVSYTLMALAVVPFSLWLAFFGKEILFLWTHDKNVAEAAAGALAFITLGTMCNALMNMPYAIQLAHNMTRLALIQNLVTLVIIGPLIWYLATHWGLTAAAIPWFLVNASYIVITPLIMHRLLRLRGVVDWYRTGVLSTVLTAIPVFVLLKLIWKPQQLNQLALFGILVAALLCAFALSFAVTRGQLKLKE